MSFFGILLKEVTTPLRSAIRKSGIPGLLPSGGSLSSFGKPYELMAREQIARDTYRFRFALETRSTLLGLPVGHHVELRLPGGSGESRPYTPVTDNDTKGSFDLAVKLYPKGKASQYLDSLKVGDTVDIAGPKGETTYKGSGKFQIENPWDNSTKELQCSRIAMVAGGSGITPLYQIAAYVMRHSEPLEVSLLFANRTPQDVMLKEELDALAAKNAAFHVTYAVDTDMYYPGEFPRHVGEISAEMVADALKQLPMEPDLVFTCGPSGFQSRVKDILGELGITEDLVVEF